MRRVKAVAETRAQALTQSVRQRLLVLLFRAFGLSVLGSMVVFLVLVSAILWQVNQPGGVYASVFSQPLKFYYLGNGSWDGIGEVFTPATFGLDPADELGAFLVLDTGGLVLASLDAADTRTDTRYVDTPGEIRSPIVIEGETVGYLVIDAPHPFSRSALRDLLLPLLFFTITSGLLVLTVGFLLNRQMINPMARVIAAMTAVADGDLSARAEVAAPPRLHGLVAGFNGMAAALERADQQRRDMLADVAHELRTPLSVIRGRLEGILDGVYPADEDHVAPVLAETYVLERLVDDLRLLTLVETRALKLDKQAVDLADLLARMVDLFAAEAEERDLRLKLVTPPDELPAVFADEQRIGQVVGNLLSNALRYSREGDTVEVRVSQTGRGVQVMVDDSGPGVPQAQHGQVFERFWRGEHSRSRATGGAGLGLAIARQLIEAHGGEIFAASSPLGGLRVCFALPAGGAAGERHARG